MLSNDAIQVDDAFIVVVPNRMASNVDMLGPVVDDPLGSPHGQASEGQLVQPHV